MSTDIEQLKDTLDGIVDSSNSLNVLIEFEEVLDALHIYSYKNWEYGEVIAGPGKTKKRESIRDRLKQLTPAEKGSRRKNPLESFGGDEKAKPHSTEKGRIASGIRKLVRAVKKK